MVHELEGSLEGAGLRVAVAAARFNDLITNKLVDGAVECLRQHGVDGDAVVVAWSAGAFELPLVAKALAADGGFDAVVAIGCVVRGETDHYEHVATQAAAGLRQAALETGVPIAFGVLATENMDQALARAGDGWENKGYEAAAVAIRQARLLAAIRSAAG